MLWAIENAARFLHERGALEELCGDVAWIKELKWGLTKEALLKVDIDLLIGENVYEVELVYPHLFPDTPAYVRPRTSTELWSTHQYGAGGVLCLEWGPDNWHSDVTGADLLRSTHKLLVAEGGRGTGVATVPSRHRVTFGQEIRASFRRMIVTPSMADFFQKLQAPFSAKITTSFLVHELAIVQFLLEISYDDTESFRSDDLPSGITDCLALASWQRKGWCFKSDTFSGHTEISNTDTLLAAIHAAGFSSFNIPAVDASTSTSTEYPFLLLGPGQTTRALTIDLHGEGKVKNYTPIGLDDTVLPRLPTDIDSLSEKTVGIVGLGSVGSKTAISLARSGLRKFLLVDDDVLLPENMTRHELNWSSVGANKVDATKEILSLVAPGLEVKVRRSRIAGQESAESASTALDALARCDLIVDATANPAVFVQLAAIAKRRKFALVWGEVFAGGIGALLARSRPKEDPNPLSMRAGIHNFLQTLPPAPLARAERYDVPMDNGPPLIAFDSEVGQFSATLTRFALDTLLDRAPSEFPHSAYLIGFKRAWVFEAPFDTRPIDIEAPSSDSEDTATNEDSLRTAAEALRTLAKQHGDANSDPSA